MISDRLVAKIAALVEEARLEGVNEGRAMARNELVAMLQQPQKNGHAPRQRQRRQAMPPIPPPPERIEPPVVRAPTAPFPVTAQPPVVLDEIEQTAPPAPEPVAGDLVSRVSDALSRMPMTQEGVDPDGLTQFINIHTVTNGDSDPITVRDVRGALRQMTMSGEARRIARGRYVAGNPPAGPLNF